MKRLINATVTLFLVTILGLSTTSCSDFLNKVIARQDISFNSTGDTQQVIGRKGGKISIAFTAGSPWTAEMLNLRADDWLTLSPESGDAGPSQITLTVSPNESYDDRNATVILSCGNTKREIVLTQKQAKALLLTSSRYEIDAEGGIVPLEIASNVSFQTESDSDWIVAASTKGLTKQTLQFEVLENEAAEPREGHIFVHHDLGKETVNIFQSGGKPRIILNCSDYQLPSWGSEFKVEVRHNVDVSVEIEPGCSWIHEVMTKGMSTNTYVFLADENTNLEERRASVKFTNNASGIAETIKVIQAQKDAIIINPNVFNVNSEGGDIEMTVGHNVEYDIEIKDSWISRAGTKSMIEDKLVFHITKNSTIDDRVGKIVLSSNHGVYRQEVTINQQCIAREALTAFYQEANGDFWTKNTNWCSDQPVNKWYGVYCNSNKEVITISLSGNNLTGHISESIGKLTGLKVLNLSFNALTGSIPEGICNLDKLETLDLSCNCLTGCIPDNIGNLAALTKFDIGFYSMRVGETINLGETGKPYNQIEGPIPASVKNLKHLETFHANFNQLSGEIPDGLWQPSLIDLNISGNKISGSISPAIGNATKLEELYIGNCELTGNLPDEICKLMNLKNFYFGNSDSLAGAGKYTTKNMISGSLPENIGDLKKLEVFYGYKINLTGKLPDSICELSSLRSINFIGCSFQGKLPENIGKLKNMQSMLIGSSGISGELPASLCDMSSLKTLWIYSNPIEGRLPEDLDKLTKLEQLLINSCQLTGNLPKCLANMPALTNFQVTNNCLSGTVPMEIMTNPNFTKWKLNPQKKGFNLVIPETKAALTLSPVENNVETLSEISASHCGTSTVFLNEKNTDVSVK